ncbi:MAG: phytoene desaturase [Armatimonadetes bacterium]|nr:phytoene desaturase [Armatimonadota bacterium]
MNKSIVIIGAGMGGLSAAIHARLLGADVVVIESAEGPGGKARAINQDGYRFDPGPSIVILTRIYDEVFRLAGRRREDYLQFERLDPFTRVYFEGQGPIDLPANREACLQTLVQVAPEDQRAVEELLRKMQRAIPLIDQTIFRKPYHRMIQLMDPKLMRAVIGFDVRKTYKQMVDDMFKSSLLRAFFYGFPSYGGQSYHAKSFGGLMIPALMIEEGVWWPVGGIGAIPAALARLAVELGVEFRNGTRVDGLVQEGDRIKGVRLEDGSKVEADIVISNRDRGTVQEWLGKPQTVEPSFSYFTVQWGLKKRKPGISHHTLLIPNGFEKGFAELYDEKKFPTRPIVYLNEVAESDPTAAPEGGGNLFAVITTPAIEDHLNWERDAQEYRQRVLNELDVHGLGIHPDEVVVERVQTPRTFEQRDGSYRGSLYGPDEKHRLWGLFPARVQDEKIKNLFYVGGAVQPGAGLPMTTLSGRFAAELALGRRLA